jgi:hypothetical protein
MHSTRAQILRPFAYSQWLPAPYKYVILLLCAYFLLFKVSPNMLILPRVGFYEDDDNGDYDGDDHTDNSDI